MRLPLYTVFLFLIPQFGVTQNMKLVPAEVSTSASWRGLSVVDDRIAWVSGTQGTVGRTNDGGKTWTIQQVAGYEKLDFRSLYAFDALHAIVANAGSPAFIFSTDDGGKNWIIVHSSSHPETFFDGIDFWNEREGLIYGDPIDNRMLLLRTDDSGRTWQQVMTAPILEQGEASFAASGTGIRCTGTKDVLICTGGSVSRLWLSGDGGNTWKDRRPPMVQGKSSTGIFSAAFAEKLILLVGGDFQDDKLATGHQVYSLDAGISWVVPKVSTRGYRECVEIIRDRTFVAAGPTGVDISIDDGETWQALSDEKGLHVVRKARKGKLVIAAGGGGHLFVVEE